MLRQIPALIDSGLTAQQIASMIGCTLGSLRVRCSKSKISLRRKNFCPNGEPRPDGARPSLLFSFHHAERHMTMTLTLPIEMARSLHQTAAAKGTLGVNACYQTPDGNRAGQARRRSAG